jgi:hypothetical protein
MIRWSTEEVTGENCLKYDSHINAWDWNSVPGYGLILANQPGAASLAFPVSVHDR